MLEGLLLPIVAAVVTLAVLITIPVIVVRSSIARRRDEARKRSSFVELSEDHDPRGDGPDGDAGPRHSG